MDTGGNVFRSGNFRLVFFGALVSELGALLYSFAVSFYILEISDNNAFLQGLYLALCGVSLLLFTPVGGVIGDRFHKGKIMFICDYCKGGIIIVATLLMLLFPEPSSQLVILFILGIVGNAVSGIFTPASGALLPLIVEEDRLQQANSYFTIKSSLESIIGIVLAGVLYAALPIHILFFIVGGCFVASGVSEMFIRYEFKVPEERLTLKVALKDTADGIRYLKTKQALLALLIIILFVNFFSTPITSNFLPFFVKTDVASAPSYLFDGFITPELWSSVFGMCFGISALVAAAVMSARKQAEKCGFMTGVKLCIIAGFAILLALSYWLFVTNGNSINAFLVSCMVFALIMGTITSVINIPISTTIMRVVDKDKLSKANSIVSVGSQGMIPISSVIAGAILNNLGSIWLLVFCSAGFLVTALIMLFNRKVREI